MRDKLDNGPEGQHHPQGAGEWFARVTSEDVSEQDRIAFWDWLEADPQNEEAYIRMEQVWATIGQAKTHFQDSYKKQPFFTSLPGKFLFDLKPAYWTAGACAGVVLCVLVILQFNFFSTTPGEVIATSVGEVRTLELVDGSQIDINTQTSLHVAVNQESRKVVLDYGEAYFSVEPDKAHLFIVHVGNRDVRVVGTEFNISFLNNRATITLIEGLVEVTGTGGFFDKARSDNVVLRPGGQVFYSGNSLITMTEDNATARITAWRVGRFVFNKSPLPVVAKELGHYYNISITVPDVYAMGLVVTAVIEREELQSTLGKLEKLVPIKVNYINDGLVEITVDKDRLGN